MSAGHGNKDAKGNTLRTHADKIPHGWFSPTSGPSNNEGTYTKRLNRAERRKLARKKK